MMEVKAAYVNFVYDKVLSDTLYTLRADGALDTWSAARIEPQVLELSGDVPDIAQWLTKMRNQHLGLSRGTGWFLYHYFRRKPGTCDVFYAVLCWAAREAPAPWPSSTTSEFEELRACFHDPDWQGPLEDIGVVFLHWYAWLMQAIDWNKYEQELLNMAQAAATREVTVLEDAKAMAAILGVST